MGSVLHHTLKSLCFNTDWSYAVIWKLKHQDHMVLAWEDAYYNSCGEGNPSDKCATETLDSLHDGSYSPDLLGLTVAMLSSHVYSLGEGTVGLAAVTGKHRWIVADDHSNNSCSAFGYGDGWQNQFSAGIRTVVVVPVIPHGVLQLGSFSEVIEDMKLVTGIQNLFFALQGSSTVSNTVECETETSLCLPNSPRENLTSAVIPDSFCSLDKAANVHFSYFGEQNDASLVSPLLSICHKAVGVFSKHRGPEISISGADVLLNPKSNSIISEHQSRVGKEMLNASNHEGKASGSNEMSTDSEHMFSHSFNRVMNNNAHIQIFPLEKFRVNLQSDLFDSTECAGVELAEEDTHKDTITHSSSIKLEDLQKREFQTETSQLDMSGTVLKFPAGCELYEALRPAFQQKSVNFDREGGKRETGTVVEIPEEMSSSKLTFDSGSEHLLEAVVANFCHSGSEVNSKKSFSKSLHSLSMTENMLEPSSHAKLTVNSCGYSIEPQKCLNSSELSGVMPSKGLSSSCPSTSTHSEPLEKSSGPGKNKRRSKPGENCRPRPRDRQLIQDRIKELRELVPSGSKCSIDSLLERTINHMLFLQSITKHADKLNKCSDMKLHSKEMGIQGSSSISEQGSSWAVEVGSHLKVCSIVVENLNKSGQMLVEMLCEDCSHFLEIAEAIKSLGLTILKGVTEAHGEKTWICFVVEGESNINIHRMDILWSLVQILQPNAPV